MDNTEATCESRESVETTRGFPLPILWKDDIVRTAYKTIVEIAEKSRNTSSLYKNL